MSRRPVADHPDLVGKQSVAQTPHWRRLRRHLPRCGALIASALLVSAMAPRVAFAIGATSVTTNGYQTCVVTDGGAVRCWGNNLFGQLGDGTTIDRSAPVTVSGLASGVAAVATGGDHTCALTTAGGVLCWGLNSSGQLGDGTGAQRLTPTAVNGLATGVAAVAAGISHTCAVTGSGAVWCWGSNSYGQLGDGTTTNSLVPLTVTGLASGVVAVAVGGYHTCALMSAGDVQCWGRNTYGQLGDGTTTTRGTPADVTGLSGTAAMVTAGTNYTCALTSAGAVQCWGSNSYGQLGDGTTTDRSTPVIVTGLASGATSVAAAWAHTCAITDAGAAFCWGLNTSGQLGDGTTTARTTPVPVVGLAGGLTAIAGGWYHTCALTSGGTVQCWGFNNNGQLGDGTLSNRSTPITAIGCAADSSTVASGYGHTCAVTSAGAVRCWGGNGYGQLGDGTVTDRHTPVAVATLGSPAVAVVAGLYHTCALTSAGAVRCWGYNNNGEVGDGTTTTRRSPVTVSGLTSGVVALAAGTYHTCALTSGGAAVCWGHNFYGQIGDGSTADQLTPVTVTGLSSGVVAVAGGSGHSCALTDTGAPRCWGRNDYGQVGDGSTTPRLTPVAVSGLASGVAEVAAGAHQTCALTTAGAALCWGDNYYGEVGDGSTTNRPVPTAVSGLTGGVSSLAPGDYHTCATTTAGAVWCWGSNAQGQIGDGTTTNRTTPVAVTGLTGWVRAVSGGSHHTCAVTAGSVVCWGYNTYGQLGDGSQGNRPAPVVVTGLASGDGSVGGGYGQTCTVSTTGMLRCWGRNDRGQVGDGTTTNHVMPVTVSGLNAGVAAVAVGGDHTCALTTAGAVHCWGSNAYSQLGDGTSTNRSTPVQVTGLTSGIVAVAAGGYHTCALTGSGAVLCWGDNSAGQLGDGTTTSRAVPVYVSGMAGGATALAGGTWHTCAVSNGGRVRCWGNNIRGPLGDGTETDRPTPVMVIGLAGGVARVSAGDAHSCALTTGGAVWCWGDNSYGQLGDGTMTGRLVPVAVSGLGSGTADLSSGVFHNCAVDSAGAAWCWGLNDDGQLGDGTTADRTTPVAVTNLASGVTAIGGGEYHSCAVTTGGALNCWGYNGTGQLGDGTTTRRLTPVVVGVHRPPLDVDGNGTSDVIWRHATGGDAWLWTMAGTTVSAQTQLGVVADTGWAIRGRGDQTGDGKADLLWRHATTGMIYLWAMDGATVTAMTSVGAVDPVFDIVGVGDYNGDGMSDILWRHATTGELWLWRMNGAAIVTVSLVATIDPAYVVVASGDLNGDGKADIVWRHATSGDVWVWLMNGATPISQTYLATVSDLGYQIGGLADFNGNGTADLLWWHATTGDVWIWTMNGAAVVAVSYVATVADTAFRVVGCGDYNGEGLADVLWHHATLGEVWEWWMNGPSIFLIARIATVPDVGYQVQAGR